MNLDYKLMKKYYKTYYYGRTISPHSLFILNDKNKHIIQSNLTKLLKDITDLFNKHDIRYFITDGTLLGAYRNASIIEHDDDLDIRIHKDDWNKYRTHLAESKYFYNNYIIRKGGENHKMDQIRCRVETPDEPLHLDLVASDYEIKINNPLSASEWLFKKCDHMFVLPTEDILINGLTVKGPNKEYIEPFLIGEYGKNYMIPQSHTYGYRNIIRNINIGLGLTVLLLSFLVYKYNFYLLIPTIITISTIIIVSSINNF